MLNHIGHLNNVAAMRSVVSAYYYYYGQNNGLTLLYPYSSD